MWLLLFTTLFTPRTEVFHSELDGAWQFGTVVERIGPEVVTEVLVERTEPVELNTAGEPDFLVNNRFEWPVESTGQPLWLEVEYQPWSQETERGFDEPVLVIFFDEELILKQNIDEICCDRQVKQVYLGIPSGQHQLSFFAGEMGDLRKPSGVVVEQLRLLGQSRSTNQVGSQIKPSSTDPETIVTGNSQSSIQVSQLDPAAETIITEPLGEGQILGVEDNQTAQSTFGNWQIQLKNLLEKSWFIGIIWLMTALLIWGGVTANVFSRLKNIFSSKNQKGIR